MTDPQKDEHIEELLSKLQGIFGKLSHSEEEESKQKIEATTPPPVERKISVPPTPEPEPEMPSPPPAPEPPPLDIPPSPPSPPPETANGYASVAPLGDPEKTLIPTAVFFPNGKETEAKSLAQKLELMTPKFTKVAFRLQVIVFTPYDPKSDWKTPMLTRAVDGAVKTVFVIVDRPLDDSKKKGITSEFEMKNIYFQDVPQASIEKKAYYTDILLGLVFFFDSRKPPETTEGA